MKTDTQLFGLTHPNTLRQRLLTNTGVPKMSPRPRLAAIRAVVLILTTGLAASAIVWSTAGRATAASTLPSLIVTQLTPPVPTSASVTAVALDDANRTLVNVDDGISVAAYLGSGSSWQRVAEFRPVTFSTIGSLLLHKDVVVGNRGSGGDFRAFLTVDGTEHEIAQSTDTHFSTFVNDINQSGTVVGQVAKGNLLHAFSITPTDENRDGVPDTWFKDEDPRDNVNDIFVDLGVAFGGASIATAINDDGTIVGIFQADGGVWKPFGTTGPDGARPNDISNSNRVVGLNTLTQRALLFPSTVLDSQGSFGNTNALSVNNRGEIVGTSVDRAGFYYDSANGIVPLNDRVPNPADRRSFSPTAINDNGVIAANASNRAFVLTPPAPADQTPPTTTAAVSPVPNAAGWALSNVTVTLVATDEAGGSGVKEIVYSAGGAQTIGATTVPGGTASVQFTAEGTTTLAYFARDVAGNQEAAKTLTVKLDKTPPTVSAAATSQPNPSGWYTATVTVQFTCADTLSGVGTCPPDQLLSADSSAASSIAQTATDVAGNTSAPSNVVRGNVDQTAPTLNCAAPDAAWHATDVSLGCTSSDATSGLANVANGSFQLSTSVPSGTETASAATGSHSVADVAGNSSRAGPLAGNKVDKKAPSITLSQPVAATYQLNQAVTASYSCSDGGSGVATCSGPVSSGAAIDTSTVGTKTLTVTATDVVGNTTSQSVSYTVIILYRFSGFLQPVDNPDTVNTGKAGRTYPVKFQLTDASGAYVSNLSAVKSITFKATTCRAFSGDPTDALETEATGSSGLRYDSTANQYVYTWKTPSTMGCYTLFVTLDSGQPPLPAYFNFS
jgi:hypothetical protein